MIRFGLLLAGIVLVGCAEPMPSLTYFTPMARDMVEPELWWHSGIAPDVIEVQMPVDSRYRYAFKPSIISFRNGEIVERNPYVMTRLKNRKLAVYGQTRLALDYADYAARNPWYDPKAMVDESRLPAKQRGLPFATGYYQHVDVLRDDATLHVIAGTHDDRMYSISTTPAPRLDARQLLAAEPKGDFVLDNAPEVFRLDAEGTLTVHVRYRVAERASGKWVSDHTCRGVTYKPVRASYLNSGEGTRFMEGMVFSLNLICEEAMRRDLVALSR